MARVREDTQLRIDTMYWALKIAQEKGVDALAQEVERRAKKWVPLQMSQADMKKFTSHVMDDCLKTVLMMAVAVLRDEYGFGPSRLSRFIDRFNLKADCIGEDYTTWDDLRDTLEEECGLTLPLPDDIEGRRA